MAHKFKCRDCACFIIEGKQGWYVSPSRYGKNIKLGYCHCHGYPILADEEACNDFTKEESV